MYELCANAFTVARFEAPPPWGDAGARTSCTTARRQSRRRGLTEEALKTSAVSPSAHVFRGVDGASSFPSAPLSLSRPERDRSESLDAGRSPAWLRAWRRARSESAESESDAAALASESEPSFPSELRRREVGWHGERREERGERGGHVKNGGRHRKRDG